MTPSVILPLCTQNNDVYRVRTLLDSGSSSSWISKDVLEYIDFASKGKVRVKVFHFEGTKAKRFEVVQIYILYRDEKSPLIVLSWKISLFIRWYLILNNF